MPSSPITTPWSAIPKTRRHPDHPLLTDPNDTAPPTPCPGPQSPRHGATERTGRPAIPMAQRHPRETPSSNPHGTAPPTRHAQQQSPWHSATHATRPAAIPMAQRHPRDTPSNNPHGTAPHTPHARHAGRPSSQPATAFHGTAPHARHARRSLPLRSKKRPLQAHIRKSTDSLRLPRFRNAQRAPAHAICRTGPRTPAILATVHDSLRLPRGSTVQCLPERINASEVPHLPRETHGHSASSHACAQRARNPIPTAQRRDTHRDTPATHLPARTIPAACHAKRTLAMRVKNTPGTQSPRHSAATHPRHTSQHARSPQPATRNARWPCVYKTRPEPNPHGTAPRHTRGMLAAHLQHARSPQPATRTRHTCAKMCTAPTRTLAVRTIPAACHANASHMRKNWHGATRARSQCARRHSESVAPSRIPAQGHGFKSKKDDVT